MRVYSGELSRRSSCYEARRIDQLKAESSVVLIGNMYKGIWLHNEYSKLNRNDNEEQCQEISGVEHPIGRERNIK